MFSANLKKYLLKRAISHPWKFDKKPKKSYYQMVVVIPSFNEGKGIQQTLLSISHQKNINFSSLLVIIVINNSMDYDKNIFYQNKVSQGTVNNFKCNYELIIIDAYNENPLPPEKAGVGLARRIGFDLSLNFINQKSILISLDADTLIHENYFKILESHFNNNKINCIIPGIFHQRNINKIENNAIIKYEKFLYSTASNIQNCGSPYGFVTMGSAISFTATCYIKAGGMPIKNATEDFYFLQNVVKTSSIKLIKKKLVFPSSRTSNRVYLGTGYRITQAKNGFDLKKLNYSEKSFKILKLWISIGENAFSAPLEKILFQAEKVNCKLPNFLVDNNIQKTWSGLQNSCRDTYQFKKQFHSWFDGLKTHKLLRYFSNLSL